MPEELWTVAGDIEQQELRRIQMARNVVLSTILVTVLATVTFVVLGMLTQETLFTSITFLTTGFLVTSLVSYWLLQRKRQSQAIALFLVGLVLALFVASQMLNGITGSLVIVLAVIVVEAGLLGGRPAAFGMALVICVLYLGTAVMEGLGVLQPQEVSAATLRVVSGVIFGASIVVTAFLVASFSDIMQRALVTSRQRGQALADANRLAEEAFVAEREARQREASGAQQLQQAVRAYAEFLQRITAGDYEARLDLSQIAASEALPAELIDLGHNLNATVESLVAALKEVQLAQQVYISQSWERFAEAGMVPLGYRYKDAKMQIDEDAWLAPMEQAVLTKGIAVRSGELAVPLDTRGQVIGAIGIRRDGDREWSDEELELVNAITDQLAQTLENLRLLDETNRRAAREQMAGEITTNIRAEIEIEAVLQRALAELGRALGAERGTAHLGLAERQEE